MIIRYLPSAQADLVWFSKYYRDRFPQGGKNASKALMAAEILLVAQPEIGAPLEDFDACGKLRVQRTPFSLIYRLNRPAIDVLRVWDSRQEKLDLR